MIELVPITDVRLKPGDWHVPMVSFGTGVLQVAVLAAKFNLGDQPVDVLAMWRRYVELLESLIRAIGVDGVKS